MCAPKVAIAGCRIERDCPYCYSKQAESVPGSAVLLLPLSHRATAIFAATDSYYVGIAKEVGWDILRYPHIANWKLEAL